MIPRRYRAVAVGTVAAAMAATAVAASSAEAQSTAIKGGVAVSRLETTGLDYWDDRLVTTSFGGHVRLRLGPLSLQPELHVLTKGASASQPAGTLEDDEIRMEYVEVPVLLVVPVTMGRIEPYIMGGPALMLESRCRSVVRRNGLRTNIPCDPPGGQPHLGQLFERTTLDWGVVAAAGVAYRIGSGQVLLEARHSRGLRNIYAGDGPAEARNRTFAVHIGYSMDWDASGN